MTGVLFLLFSKRNRFFDGSRKISLRSQPWSWLVESKVRSTGLKHIAAGLQQSFAAKLVLRYINRPWGVP